MRRFIFVGFTLGFVLSGCSSDPGTGGGPGTSGAPVCTEANECGAGLVCVSEQCVLPQCTVDQECNAGLRCIEYRCRFLGSMDATVDSDSQPSDQDASMTDDAAVTRPDQFIRDAAIQPDARSFEFDLGTLDAEATPDDALTPDTNMTDGAPLPQCVTSILIVSRLNAVSPVAVLHGVINLTHRCVRQAWSATIQMDSASCPSHARQLANKDLVAIESTADASPMPSLPCLVVAARLNVSVMKCLVPACCQTAPKIDSVATTYLTARPIWISDSLSSSASVAKPTGIGSSFHQGWSERGWG